MKNIKRLVFDYINGNDIQTYTIEELENNPEFMLEVMKFSKDKKMYNLCSKNVKNNYQFIKEVIQLFKNEKDFIIMITTEYFSNNPGIDEQFYELNILMSEILENDEDAYQFKIETSIFFAIILEKIFKRFPQNTINTSGNSPIDNSDDDFDISSDDNEKIFSDVEKVYEENEIILKYFAKRFINRRFNIITSSKLEKMLHKKFTEVSELTDKNINEFLIEQVCMYYDELPQFVYEHIDLLDEIKKTINSYKLRWNNFFEKDINNKIDNFYEAVDKYFSDHENDIVGCFSEIDIIEYAIKKLKLEDIFQKYDMSWKIENDGSMNIPWNGEYYKTFDGYHNDEIKEIVNIQQQLDNKEVVEKINEKKLLLLEIKALRFVIQTADNIFNKDIEIGYDYCQKDETKKKNLITEVNFHRNK